ncbi:uncharacterized protein LOC108629304 [Ceratina calcarata]|uniref:Uncharacterized protein LOC108629304 n=1 Tax=Ceratina calcarata TaxID=156304 RepID=A0AAJ7NBQ7_9HYME|nr:uncharacterized protein LOC108629304 [Ceratina calcarata]
MKKTERSFIIEGELVGVVNAYQALRPRNSTSDRFFLTYRKGKCINQPLGKNRLGCMPREIAKFLKLKNPDEYTGHCFRRSSAILCAVRGITMTDLSLRGWKSTRVTEGYIGKSIRHKMKTRKRITKVIGETSCDELSSGSAPLEKLEVDAVSLQSAENVSNASSVYVSNVSCYQTETDFL